MDSPGIRSTDRFFRTFNRPWKIMLLGVGVTAVFGVPVMLLAGWMSPGPLAALLFFSSLIGYGTGHVVLAYARKLEAHQAALEQVNEQLAVRNADLEAYSYTVAHDLKTPIQNIIGYAHLLEDPEGGDDLPVEEIALSIQASARKMTQIIDELLLLASVDSVHIPRSRLEMGPLIEDVLERLGPSMRSSGAQVEKPDFWPAAIGHRPWVEEVWYNYLSNAIKYGGTPPMIRLGADQAGDVVRFWVADNGAGIPRHLQDDLFKDFTRLNMIQEKGYGLGLAIVRRIMDKLGGKYGVDSSEQGACFFFELPAAA